MKNSEVRRCWVPGLVPGLVLLLTMSMQSQAARVLLVPWILQHHVHQFLVIGQDLLNQGHDVHVVISSSVPFLNMLKETKFKIIIYKANEPDLYVQRDLLYHSMGTSMKSLLQVETLGFKETCRNPLKDEKLHKTLKTSKFDLAIVDVFPTNRCMLVLMHRLGIPYVNMHALTEPWLLRNPALPSTTPFVYGDNAYTAKMNFWQRLDNLWSVIEWYALPSIEYTEDDFLKKYFYETDPVPIGKLMGNALLWLIDQMPLLDYPNPIMPNEVHIGGLTVKPAEPLPEDLQKFMSANTNGTIVMSFGLLWYGLPQEIIYRIIAAFELVKYNVIVQFPMELEVKVSSHIKLLPWIPQNDLLGHKNTKLLITHCGGNSQSEALYHGVPMIGFPMFAGQLYNARRSKFHRFGKYMSLERMKTADLVAGITEVIENSSYTENIQAASAAFHDQPMTPREKALYWIEHVLKHGGHHLRSRALDMVWYEYLMLDISAFMFGVLIVFVVISCCILKKVLSMFFSSEEKAKAE